MENIAKLSSTLVYNGWQFLCYPLLAWNIWYKNKNPMGKKCKPSSLEKTLKEHFKRLYFIMSFAKSYQNWSHWILIRNSNYHIRWKWKFYSLFNKINISSERRDASQKLVINSLSNGLSDNIQYTVLFLPHVIFALCYFCPFTLSNRFTRDPFLNFPGLKQWKI